MCCEYRRILANILPVLVLRGKPEYCALVTGSPLEPAPKEPWAMSRIVSGATIGWTTQADVLADTTETRVIESADPVDMETQVAATLAEFAARSNPAFGLAFLDLAGGGDGHTFVCTMEFGAENFVSTIPIGFIAGILFYMASERSALLVAREATQARLVPLLSQNQVVTEIQTGLAGTSKGTRFMGYVFALNIEPL
jgi:hypothetical protein